MNKRSSKLILLCVFIVSGKNIAAMDDDGIKIYKPDPSCIIKVFKHNPSCLGVIQTHSLVGINNYYVYVNGKILNLIGCPKTITRHIAEQFIEKKYLDYFNFPSEYTINEFPVLNQVSICPLMGSRVTKFTDKNFLQDIETK